MKDTTDFLQTIAIVVMSIAVMVLITRVDRLEERIAGGSVMRNSATATVAVSEEKSHPRVTWPKAPFECVTYIVGYGDTIWGIATRYFPNKNPQIVEETIRRINSLTEETKLRPGQKIIIPDPELYGKEASS